MSIYGVSTGNAFAILDEDYEEISIPAEEATEVKDNPITKHSNQGDKRGRGGRAARGGGRKGEYAGSRNHTSDGQENSGVGDSFRGGRGRNTRGRASNFVSRNKREYDRRDGTGRGHESEKRHGGGKANWGVPGEDGTATNSAEGAAPGWELTEETKAEDAQQQEKDEALPADGEAKADVEGGEEGEAKEQETKVEEKQYFTLAEYEKMQKEKSAPSLTSAKKGAPIVDTKQFDGMAELKKSNEGSGFELLAIERTRKRREKREKEVTTVEVGFRVGEPRRRGRGGRGRGRSRDFENDSSMQQQSQQQPQQQQQQQQQKWSNEAGTSTNDFPPRQDSGNYPNFRGGGGGRRYPGRRGGRGGGRASYGEQASRHSGPAVIDIASEKTFPTLS